MKRYHILYLTALCLLFGACDEDLQIAPPSSISINSFFKNEDDAQSALNGVYVQMRNVAGGLSLYGDERADNTRQTDLGTGNDANRNTIQPTTEGSDWGGYYSLLKDVNFVLAKVPDITFTDEKKRDDLLAQAHFIRAWTYFMIVRIWGDAPLITEPFESPNQEGLIPKQRDPASALFTQIKSDIDEALRLFSDNSLTSRYAATVPATNMLKTDVYLWTAKREGGGTADLNTALAAVNAVIGLPSLELLDNYADVFRPTTATNEDIFSLYRDLVEGGGFFAGRYNLSDSFWASLSEEDKARVPFIRGSVRFYTATETLREQIATNAALGIGETDPREAIYFLPYTDPSGEERYVMNKYQGEEITPGQREFTDDVKIYRYADAILMHAEISNALSNTADAVADLNLIRNRVGIGDYADGMSQEEVDAAILQERAIEFAFEAKRWWDLVRFDKAYELVPSLIGREGEQPILWPISINTRALNPNLKQTPGY